MNRSITACFVALAALALSPMVHAQATRTWVSGVGDDANPCSRTAPCKTFAGAISKTADHGFINVIDPGGFGAITITKNITIDGTGAQAGLLSSLGTSSVVVNGAGIKVVLRNLSIEGVSGASFGVNIVQAGQVTVENCVIKGFTAAGGAGIRGSTAASTELIVTDTNITDSANGILIGTSAGQFLATLDNVRIENTTNHGLNTTAGTVFVVVRNSMFNHNNLDGARAGTAGTVLNLVDSSFSFNNGTSVNAAVAGARIRISGNTIVNNNIALGLAAGAFIESASNNNVAGFGSTAAPNAVFGSM